MKHVIVSFLSLLLSSCGYTTNSSIDNNIDEGDKYSFYLNQYCNNERNQKAYIAFTQKNNPKPAEVAIDGELYVLCGEENHVFAVKQKIN